MIKLIASDMDGTLLTTKREISQRSKEAIAAAREKGVIFTISTGRSVKGLKLFEEILAGDVPAITYNGATIIKPDTEEKIFEKLLEPEDIRRIIERGLEQDTTMCIWAANNLYGNKINEMTAEYKKLCGVEAQIMPSIDEMIKETVTKILWYDTPERINSFEAAGVTDGLKSATACKSCPIFLEFFNSGVSKGVALEKIAEYYHLDRSEVMALGDGQNDVPMLEYAGVGVAMGNAPEEVKKHADFVTLTNDEDGLAYAIEKYVLGE